MRPLSHCLPPPGELIDASYNQQLTIALVVVVVVVVYYQAVANEKEED